MSRMQPVTFSANHHSAGKEWERQRLLLALRKLTAADQRLIIWSRPNPMVQQVDNHRGLVSAVTSSGELFHSASPTSRLDPAGRSASAWSPRARAVALKKRALPSS